ncbi:MAG: MerR family transcriptional regulator [Verrucomicrobiales bacterium]|nr:MerR family transcriptional regulator [Verrucomicrobiales bacterium]
MVEAHYPIQLVAHLTGLSAHVIRIWEHRYQAVDPRRTRGNRRVYSERHVERLNLLRDATSIGHRISQVAHLPTAELRRLAGGPALASGPGLRLSRPVSTVSRLIDESLSAVHRLADDELRECLRRAVVELGILASLHRVAAPLAQAIGDQWREGTITAAHEHFATAVIRDFLATTARPLGSLAGAPVLLVATPAGQIHEIGALLAASTALNLGWQVTYLGASLPAEEIAGAARQCGAKVVALSLVYPEDDPFLDGELTRLRQSLPDGVALLAGGRAMPSFARALRRIGAIPVDGLAALGATLERLRRMQQRNRC